MWYLISLFFQLSFFPTCDANLAGQDSIGRRFIYSGPLAAEFYFGYIVIDDLKGRCEE